MAGGDEILGSGYLYPAKPFNTLNPSGISAEQSLGTITQVGEGNRNRAVQRQEIASRESMQQQQLQAGAVSDDKQIAASQDAQHQNQTFTAEEAAKNRELQQKQLDAEAKRAQDESDYRMHSERMAEETTLLNEELNTIREETANAIAQGATEKLAALQSRQAEINDKIALANTRATKLDMLYNMRNKAMAPETLLPAIDGIIDQTEGTHKVLDEKGRLLKDAVQRLLTSTPKALEEAGSLRVGQPKVDGEMPPGDYQLDVGASFKQGWSNVADWLKFPGGMDNGDPQASPSAKPAVAGLDFREVGEVIGSAIMGQGKDMQLEPGQAYGTAVSQKVTTMLEKLYQSADGDQSAADQARDLYVELEDKFGVNTVVLDNLLHRFNGMLDPSGYEATAKGNLAKGNEGAVRGAKELDTGTQGNLGNRQKLSQMMTRLTSMQRQMTGPDGKSTVRSLVQNFGQMPPSKLREDLTDMFRQVLAADNWEAKAKEIAMDPTKAPGVADHAMPRAIQDWVKKSMQRLTEDAQRLRTQENLPEDITTKGQLDLERDSLTQEKNRLKGESDKEVAADTAKKRGEGAERRKIALGEFAKRKDSIRKKPKGD